MTWIAQLTAVYADADEASSAMEVIERELAKAEWATAKRRGRTITARLDYGDRSKYGSVRVADSILHEVFDPVADDEYYRPWPERVSVRSRWVAP